MADLVDAPDRRWSVRPGSLTIRVAEAILAHGGEASFGDLQDVARDHGPRPGRAARGAIRALEDFGLAVREGDTVRAVDVAELAGWVAEVLSGWEAGTALRDKLLAAGVELRPRPGWRKAS